MARGGYRPGAGRPKGSMGRPRVRKANLVPKSQEPTPKSVEFSAPEAPQPVRMMVEVAPAADAPDPKTPLGYMLAVMNDPEADEARRDKLAIAAAPFMHPRIADNRFGKKDAAKEAAVRAGKSGRFAQPAMPPKLVVNNGAE